MIRMQSCIIQAFLFLGEVSALTTECLFSTTCPAFSFVLQTPECASISLVFTWDKRPADKNHDSAEMEVALGCHCRETRSLCLSLEFEVSLWIDLHFEQPKYVKITVYIFSPHPQTCDSMRGFFSPAVAVIFKICRALPTQPCPLFRDLLGYFHTGVAAVKRR